MEAKLNIYHIEREGNQYTLDIVINEKGDLVLEGYDRGQRVKEISPGGDWDYEYWLTIEAKYKDRLLLELLKKQFGGGVEFQGSFKNWLNYIGIPSEFQSY